MKGSKLLGSFCLPSIAPHREIPDWRNIGVKLTFYLSELRRDFLASVGITYAVFRIAKSRLRQFGEFC